MGLSLSSLPVVGRVFVSRSLLEQALDAWRTQDKGALGKAIRAARQRFANKRKGRTTQREGEEALCVMLIGMGHESSHAMAAEWFKTAITKSVNVGNGTYIDIGLECFPGAINILEGLWKDTDTMPIAQAALVAFSGFNNELWAVGPRLMKVLSPDNQAFLNEFKHGGSNAGNGQAKEGHVSYRPLTDSRNNGTRSRGRDQFPRPNL